EPAVERLLEGARHAAQVGVPDGGIPGRLLRGEAEEQRVAAAGLHPAAEGCRPGLAASMRPLDEHVREAALDEELGQAADEPFGEGVARKAAVAVDELRLGRDDVRRARDDQVAPLARARSEE